MMLPMIQWQIPLAMSYRTSAITENQDSSIRQAIRMISPDEPESAINSYDLFSPRSGDLTFYGSLPNAGDSEPNTY